MVPARGSLVLYDELVAIDEAYGAQCGALDILCRGLVVDNLLRAIAAAEHYLKVVLLAVYAEEVELSCGCPLDEGDILVLLIAYIHLALRSRSDVVEPQLHLGVCITCLGVFEGVGFVVELPVEAHHLKCGYLTLIEAQVCNLL